MKKFTLLFLVFKFNDGQFQMYPFLHGYHNIQVVLYFTVVISKEERMHLISEVNHPWPLAFLVPEILARLKERQ